MGLLGKIGGVVGGAVGSYFGPVGAKVGSMVGQAVGNMAEHAIEKHGHNKSPQVRDAAINVIRNSYTSNVNFNLNQFMSQQKLVMSPIAFHQLQNAVHELHGQVDELFKMAHDLDSKGVPCTKPDGSEGGDWFMKIASALAAVIQRQADAVAGKAKSVTDLSKAEDASRQQQASQGPKDTSGNAGASTNATESPQSGKLQEEMTMLKAEAEKLEFLTTAVNTTLDKISGSLNQLGRAG